MIVYVVSMPSRDARTRKNILSVFDNYKAALHCKKWNKGSSITKLEICSDDDITQEFVYVQYDGQLTFRTPYADEMYYRGKINKACMIRLCTLKPTVYFEMLIEEKYWSKHVQEQIVKFGESLTKEKDELLLQGKNHNEIYRIFEDKFKEAVK